eukprot:CAMPEP_0172617080 /NCGR_PEP_ID=MMETSP1068-20121228/70021_1 /TAXON_ID=35684 /ORGANISM="Pseudopedinella elastica, Strain CCMP716" /LENGTH=150 /DNA_ID=CAMNT_0013422747 /DNA_START=760 /DNA_END=1209 /DNA_ORIENTATION=+
MINAAVSGSESAGLTVPFVSSERFGAERAGIQEHGTGEHVAAGSSERIRVTTVDEIVSQEMGGAFPSLLSIDTEGHDALVLQGAANTLRSGKLNYVEFEYHEVGPWGRMKLEDTINLLDSFDFDCYLALRPLVRVTGCWDWGKFGDHREW